MGEVVGFVKREPREELKEEAKQVKDDVVFTCNTCKSMSFILHLDGDTECVACGVRCSDAGGEWRRRLVDPTVEPEELEEAETATTAVGVDQEYIRQEFIHLLKSSQCIAVFMALNSGVTKMWCNGVDGEEGLAEYRERLTSIDKFLTRLSTFDSEEQ